MYEVPPGKRAWPYHYHLANEEAVYVLEAGDRVALKKGEAGAHGVINTSEVPLRYLYFPTMAEPDVLVYPDSRKIGISAGSAPGGL